MSVIAVQAGYGQYVIDRQPGDARAALGAIQATSREALDEIGPWWTRGPCVVVPEEGR